MTSPIKNLTDEQLDKRLKEVEERKEIEDTFRNYSGSDRIVSVKEARDIISVQKPAFKVVPKLSKLNKLIDGFQTGELVVVSGPTGMGKTTLLQSFTYDFNDQKVPCVWFSYEVGIRDLMNRFKGYVPNFYLPLENVESNVKWLAQRIWESIVKFDTKVVFIDHLHYLLDMGYLSKVNSSLAIGMLMRDLKKLALKTDTVIFLISHLGKTRMDTIPDISDLRDSSFIGQESDIVLMVWRDKEDSYLKVVKNRRVGTQGAVKVTLEKGRFYEVTTR